MNTEDEVLAVGFERAARLLGVSARHLRNHYVEYEVPYRKLGGRVLFPVDELRDWLHNNRPQRKVEAAA